MPFRVEGGHSASEILPLAEKLEVSSISVLEIGRVLEHGLRAVLGGEKGSELLSSSAKAKGRPF